MSQPHLTLTKNPVNPERPVMIPSRSEQLAYIQRSQHLLTERLYMVPMSALSRFVTKHAIERLGHEAMRLHWGLPRFATRNPR